MSQLARNAHPDFAFKNQKPRFSVAVNDENWFAQQCNSIKMLNAGAGDVLDLLDSTVGTISSNAPGWGTNRNRRMVETVANGGFNYYGVEFSSGLTFQGGNGGPGITIAIVGRFNGRGGSSNYANLVRDTGDDGLCINGSNQVTWVSGFARLTSSNSLSAGEYFTLIAGYEYNTATTFILLNGVLTTGSPGGFSINGSMEGWGGTSGQGNCAVEYNLFAHIPRIITTDQARAWSKDVYQIVRPAVPMSYRVSAGGSNYSDSISLGLSNNITGSGMAQANGSVTLANEVGCADSGGAQSLGSAVLDAQISASSSGTAQTGADTTFNNQLGVAGSGISQALASATYSQSLGFVTDGIIAFDVSATFSTALGMTHTGQATGSGAISLSASLDASIAAIAQTIASATLSNLLTVTVSSGQTIADSIALGISQGLNNLGSISISGTVTLSAALANSITATAQTQGALSLGAQIGISVLAQAAALAGITLSNVVSVVTAGNVTYANVTTPDGRVYTIALDARTLIIESDDRTYTVN